MKLEAYVKDLDLVAGETYVTDRHTMTIEEAEMPRLGEKEQAFFSEKSIVSFAAEVSEKCRRDVLQTTLLAQMAANGKVPAGDDLVRWYEAFIEVLEKVGWVVEAKDIQSFSSKSDLFEVDSVVIDILTTAFGAGYITVIKKTLESIKKLAVRDRKIKAFEHNTTMVSKGCFQIAMTTESNGVANLKIGTFILNSKHNMTTILFFKSDRQVTTLDYFSRQASLDTEIYGAIRKEVKNRLGHHLRTNIAEIDLF